MTILAFIKGLLLAIKEAFKFLDNKQQLDAGKALAKEEATNVQSKRIKTAKAIDAASSNRTDDFRL